MSDLDRVLDKRMAAYEPTIVPPYDAVRGRARRRIRLRRGGAGMVSLAVVAAVVTGGIALGGGGRDRVVGPLAAEGTTSRVTFTVVPERTYVDGSAGAVDRDRDLAACSGLPGGSPAEGQLSDPASWQVGAEGTAAQVAAVRGCLERLGSVSVGAAAEPVLPVTSFYVRPVGTESGYDAAVQACFAAPGAEGSSVEQARPASYKGSVRGQAAAQTLRACLSAVPGAVVQELPSRPPGTESVTICQGAEPCQHFGLEEARELTDAFAGATPAKPDTVACAADSVLYRVELTRSDGSRVWDVLAGGCGSVRSGGKNYVVPVALPGLVRRIFEQAGNGPSLAAFVQRCLAGASPRPAPEYLGRREAALEGTVRIVGRDGSCLNRDLDLRPNRVNVLVVRGTVVWAGRF